MFFATLIQAPKHQVFDIAKASPEFAIKVDLVPDDPTSEPLTGSARVMIISRASHKTVQTIRMASVAIFKEQLATSVGKTGKQPELYDDQYSFVFEDFNFDGHPDLAICKDIQGSYGAMSYDIFLWNAKQKRFVKDAQLSKLSSEHLGLLEVDRKRRELITFDKSGAAWHLTSTYKYLKGRPRLVETEVEDATSGYRDVITTKRRVGKHWRTRVRVVREPN